MGFDIIAGADRRMYPGQIIEYRVSPLLGIKTKWVTEITHVVPNEYFVDEQRFWALYLVAPQTLFLRN